MIITLIVLAVFLFLYFVFEEFSYFVNDLFDVLVSLISTLIGIVFFTALLIKDAFTNKKKSIYLNLENNKKKNSEIKYFDSKRRMEMMEMDLKKDPSLANKYSKLCKENKRNFEEYLKYN